MLREGIDPTTVHLTGNTVIDALLMMADRPVTPPVTPAAPRYLLVTAHRRENFGDPLQEVCLALLDLVERYPDLSVIYPVHPNPHVRRVVNEWLVDKERIHLIEPTGYPEFVALMKGRMPC